MKKQMMKKITLLGFILVFIFNFSQVGINTEVPKATLDVVHKSTGLLPAGLIPPRLAGDEIKAMDSKYGNDQNGAIIYATDPVTAASDKTRLITKQGYYYYSAFAQKWLAIGSMTEPWQNIITGESATSNNEDIYQTGKVAIGNAEIHESSIFQVNANNKGVLIPRLTTAERESISSPADGLLIYNKSTGCYNYYTATPAKWLSICGEPDPSIINVIDCTNTGAYGTYKKATTLTSSNTYTIKVNVLQVGPYNISLYTGNGYSFSKSGTFTSTGSYTLELEGQGTPTNAQTDNVTLSFNGTGLTTTCTLPGITVADNTTEFTLNCGASTFGGTLKVGVATDGTQYMDIPVISVANNGNALIETPVVNGIKYSSGTVVITSTTTSIRLYAQGTPSAIGTFAYSFSTPGSLLPCSVNIDVITALGTFDSPADRCYQILQANPYSLDGEYFIKGVNGEAFKTYCDMTNGGYTMLQSYSEKALLNEDADLRQNQNLNWNGNKNYALAVGSTGIITYRNFLLPLSVRQTVRSSTTKNVYRVRVVQDVANVVNNNDLWAKDNYAVIDFSSGVADLITGGSTFSYTINSKVFGKNLIKPLTGNSGATFDGMNLVGSAYFYNGYDGRAFYANDPGFSSYAFNYINPNGSSTSSNTNKVNHIWSIRADANNNYFSFNHNIGKCRVGGLATGAIGDDYNNTSAGVNYCKYNALTPHSFNGGEGRYVQWFVK